MWPFDHHQKKILRQEKERAFVASVTAEHERIAAETDAALRYDGLRKLAEKIELQPKDVENTKVKSSAAVLGLATGLAAPFGMMAATGIDMFILTIFVTPILGLQGGDIFYKKMDQRQREFFKERVDYSKKINDEMKSLLNDDFQQMTQSPHFRRMCTQYRVIRGALEREVERKFQQSGLAEQFKAKARAEINETKPLAMPTLPPLLKITGNPGLGKG